ncbi:MULTISPECIES: response regulator [Variovorax]|jgi:two-component system, OmpR family, response regulator BaeR|uniref:response regulator n=1 Tax=Variovorax TaxID=34072 RepID=UPI00086A82D6|nr:MULTISPECIES: response regulator [Variovorax]MBN8754376.1 response regulator [Variovorax sp.]ODU17430.1 MAG: two-component system response regulator BaeR [Variovorax sp. SCN 67-85]ODV25849.1 MAG: two-component system response regulator BaeR [Variovorax sp. SCN 67-20]OJZ03992.1 MAG: two-component system response regulator BaeR [Variovorax sp. 67-131]UKI10141.1 response regulator [Variovorax paradoxus]
MTTTATATSEKQPVAHILIVEDEPRMAALLADYLQASGYTSQWIANGLEAVPSVKARRPDLVLLDVMLPGQDGMSVCRELRQFSEVPVIMLTARVEEADRLMGLELGADDYICKTPFSPREVVARVKALLRRSGYAAREPSPLQIDAQAYKAAWQGVTLDLTPVEFRLLKALTEARGRVLSRDKLLDFVHADQRAVTDRAVDSHVKNLRRKLHAASGGQELIRSIYGVGYRLDLP